MKCLMCGKETEMVININLKAKPLCNPCSLTIMAQTAIWVVQIYKHFKEQDDKDDDPTGEKILQEKAEEEINRDVKESGSNARI